MMTEFLSFGCTVPLRAIAHYTSLQKIAFRTIKDGTLQKTETCGRMFSVMVHILPHSTFLGPRPQHSRAVHCLQACISLHSNALVPLGF